MPRYAAFLRGVMPMNAKMPELKTCFEQAGFSEVRTLGEDVTTRTWDTVRKVAA